MYFLPDQDQFHEKYIVIQIHFLSHLVLWIFSTSLWKIIINYRTSHFKCVFVN